MLLEVFGLAFLAAKLAQPCIHCAALRAQRKSVKKVWDKADSSDEDDWLAELLYGDDVRDVDRKEVMQVMHRAYTERMEGVRELSHGEKEERAKARQERREAREAGRDGARENAKDGRRIATQQSSSHLEQHELEMQQYGPHNPAAAATEL